MSLDIVWSNRARSRLAEIRDFIAQDKPGAAERLAIRIATLVEALRQHPHLGRRGSISNTRELIVGGTPYIIQYRVHGNNVIIQTVRHASQFKPGA